MITIYHPTYLFKISSKTFAVINILDEQIGTEDLWYRNSNYNSLVSYFCIFNSLFSNQITLQKSKLPKYPRNHDNYFY